jgi:hypothetical protein
LIQGRYRPAATLKHPKDKSRSNEGQDNREGKFG